MGGRDCAMESVDGQMNGIDLDFYKGKRVFVTGHTGFKGSWLCRVLLNAGAAVTGYSLPAPTEPNLFSLADIESRMVSVIGDIRDRAQLTAAFQEAKPEIVFHLAAQPIVRDSYRHPAGTYEVNVMGTVNLLECIRTAQIPVRSVVIVTTDKVYENQEWVWGYRENERLNGHDPYSNSKSCAELVAQTYQRSFFEGSDTAISTVRAGNVIGGGDFSRDRILPDCVRAVQAGKRIIVRNPDSTRPYQHVLEALLAYLMVAQRQYGDKDYAGWYNVGPEEQDCITTGTLADMFCQKWGDGLAWVVQTERNAPHESSFLKLDCTKLKTTFGWQPQWHIEQAVEKTVEWTKAWLLNEDLPAVMDRQICTYLQERR